MPYNINKSDPNKVAITIPDMPPGVNNNDTSLQLVGKNYPLYGKALNENFLQLLENFASPYEPANPIQGQLWYDTSSEEATLAKLYVFDGGAWCPTNGVWQLPSPNQPKNPKPGDIWVDTNSSQLFLTADGINWTLVGPTFSGTRLSGAYPTQIVDRNGNEQEAILMYLSGSVIEIISKTAFIPLQVIEGFSNIVPGVNISTKKYDGSTPQFVGISQQALFLKQSGGESVSADNFVRNDIDQRMNGTLVINKDSGLFLGANNPTFGLQKNNNNNIFSNLSNSGKFIFQITKDQIANTLLTLDGGTSPLRISVGTTAKETALTVYGDTTIDQKLTVSSTASSALTVVGGVVSSTLLVNGPATITSTVQFAGTLTLGISTTTGRADIIPSRNGLFDLGSISKQFRSVYAGTFGTTGTTIYGTLQGSATKLAHSTNFLLGGQLSSQAITFDGQSTVGTETAYVKVLNATLTSAAIVGHPISATAGSTDALLIATGVGSTSTQLARISKKNFLSDLYGPDATLYSNSFVDIVPPGTMLLWPGVDSTIPNGFLKCDGALYPQAGQYVRLFQLIGITYGGNATQFSVPTALGPISGTNYIIKY
jgi:hypothetical protein